MSAFGALLEGFEPDVEYDLDEQGIPVRTFDPYGRYFLASVCE
jgi:hypothetical protein